MEGVNVEVSLYDPRKGLNVESNNPMLILADIMIKGGFADKKDQEFWDKISYLANYADEKVNGNGHKPKRLKLETKIQKKLIEKKLIRKKKLNDKKTLVRQKIMQDKET